MNQPHSKGSRANEWTHNIKRAIAIKYDLHPSRFLLEGGGNKGQGQGGAWESGPSSTWMTAGMFPTDWGSSAPSMILAETWRRDTGQMPRNLS